MRKALSHADKTHFRDGNIFCHSTLEPKGVMDVMIAMLVHQMPKELSE
ncbi:hypothetical protein [Tolypothrix sp. NIES-4075]|nr:hypothetical protein [Tolypothrix sp. NIES-4075]